MIVEIYYFLKLRRFMVIHGGCACSKVRVHSECFTGDVLGSKRCDCGPQLRGDGAMGRGAIRKLCIRSLKAFWRLSRYVKMWRIVEDCGCICRAP